MLKCSTNDVDINSLRAYRIGAIPTLERKSHPEHHATAAPSELAENTKNK